MLQDATIRGLWDVETGCISVQTVGIPWESESHLIFMVFTPDCNVFFVRTKPQLQVSCVIARLGCTHCIRSSL
jgi:hypothetical protein